MAKRVIVVGTNRAKETISIGELKQFIGRAGRGHEIGQCSAEIIVDSEDYSEISDAIETKQNTMVKSDMFDIHSLCFHIYPDIQNGNIKSKDDIDKWLQRSLLALKYDIKSLVLSKSIIGHLASLNAIGYDFDSFIGELVNIKPTAFGNIASAFYLHVSDLSSWRYNFKTLCDNGLHNNDCALAWALADVRCTEYKVFSPNNEEIEDNISGLLPSELRFYHSSRKIETALYLQLFGGPSVPKGGMAIGQIRKNLPRIIGAIKELNLPEVRAIGGISYLDNILYKAKKRIPFELEKLYQIQGMTKEKALELYEIGIADKEEALKYLENME